MRVSGVSEWRAPVLRRFTIRVAIELAVLVAISFGLLIGPQLGLWSLPAGLNDSLPVAAGVAAAGVAWVVWSHRRWRRVQQPIIRRVLATGGRVCPRCGYDLGPLDVHGRCPECGAAYTRESLRAAWWG